MERNKMAKNRKYNMKIEDDFWENDIKEVKECSKAPEELKIIMNILPAQKIKLLNEKFKNIEWLAYLVGDGLEVKDLYIPYQEVSSVTVDNIKSPEYNRMNIIGVIHSHHNMNNSFSGTDDEYINKNHDISICVSSNMNMNAQVRWKTPCGSIKIIKGVVDIIYDKDISWIEEFLEEVDKRIKKKFINLSGMYHDWQSYKNHLHNNQKLIDDYDYDYDYDYNDDYNDDGIEEVDDVINNMTIDKEMELYKDMMLDDDE